MNNGTTCLLTQLFGENKNRLFYGPEGHKGLDFKTKSPVKFKRNWGEWIKDERTPDEAEGFIPIVAAHGGYLTTNFYYRARSVGWGMFITYKEDDYTEYRTLYWHIEKPWRRLGLAWKGIISIFRPEVVKPGAIIAIGGNSGYPRSSTGPHLHFELQKREYYNGKWSSWKSIDPMPFFQDWDTVYQKFGIPESRWFHKGKEVTTLEAKEIIKKIC